MSQTPSTEDILQRMRAHVSQHGSRDQAFSTESNQVSGASPNFGLNAHDLSPLRFEIETAVEGTRQVGQLNPRKPGLINGGIQLLKKVMRRSLSWYTRPIHYFQGAVIRALQQILVLTQAHDESLQKMSRELTKQAGVIEEDAHRRAKQYGTLDDAISGLKRDELALERKANLLENKSAALGHRSAALEHKAAFLAEQDAKLQVTVSALQQKGEALEQTLSALQQSIGGVGARLAGISKEVDQLSAASSGLSNDLHETKLQNRVRDRDLRRFFHDIQAGTFPSAVQPNPYSMPPMFPSDMKQESEFDYFLFEERYRGDEALIAKRQKEYLGYFKGCEDVLDIGCGRGEFLELLREHGVRARGVELGTDQYLLCREKALDVVRQDMFSYLESQPDQSLGGLFSAQVIEHLAASDQLRFVSLAYRKTRPGSPVIFETINAQCVFAVVRNFFLDPTHLRPVHPETLKFAMESAKFHDVELRFSSPMSERRIPPLNLNGNAPQLREFNRAIEELNNLIYGFMDYAAIGWR